MTKVEQYQETLRRLDDWEEFLLADSRLPGRRANLELVPEADEPLLLRLVGSDEEFLVMCGAVRLGRLSLIAVA